MPLKIMVNYSLFYFHKDNSGNTKSIKYEFFLLEAPEIDC